MQTCCDITGSDGANNVHEPNCYHLLVSIHPVFSQSSKSPSYCNAFLLI